MTLYQANFALSLLTQIEFGANQIPRWYAIWKRVICTDCCKTQ